MQVASGLVLICVISSLLLHNKALQAHHHKKTHIYYVTFYVGQESGYGLSGCSLLWVLQGCNHGIKRLHSQVWVLFQVHMVVGQIQILAALELRWFPPAPSLSLLAAS